jgi:hypothetical protein
MGPRLIKGQAEKVRETKNNEVQNETENEKVNWKGTFPEKTQSTQGH